MNEAGNDKVAFLSLMLRTSAATAGNEERHQHVPEGIMVPRALKDMI